MMDFSRSPPCPHLGSQHVSIVDINKLENVNSCAKCDYDGLNLWICLQRNCLRVGCSETVNDHSTEHFQNNQNHCVHLNLSSQRAWCYLCEREVFLDVKSKARLQDPFAATLGDSAPMHPARDTTQNTNDQEYETAVPSVLTGGLVGLQNIANTCYMNSALQALSNVVPLTHYFLNCGDLVQHTLEQSALRAKAGLARNYQQLMRDIWCRRSTGKDCIAPRGLLYGIRSVYPMFRGFQQHDTQEFLRCFMDQLHEELKESRQALPQYSKPPAAREFDDEDQPHELPTRCSKIEDDTFSTSSSSSQSNTGSDSEYETCDSGSSQEGFKKAASSNGFFGGNQQLNGNAAAFGEQRKRKSSPATQLSCPAAVHSIISDIFDGKLLSSVQCLTCDRVSTREETFQDLSLPIPNRDHLNLLHQTHSVSAQSLNSIDVASTTTRNGNEGWLSRLWNMVMSWLWGPSVTLYDCMASFFSADELKGDNMYSCEKCNKLRTGVKYSQILQLPEVLCVHLKRFRNDLAYSSKISSRVHFPLEGFDLRPYLHKDCSSNIAVYQLVSVICHHGTVGGGHYTCYARNALSNLWYEYDDQHVTEVTPEVVQNCQAYVLFYQKFNPQIELLRAEASELAATSSHSTNGIRFYLAREWLARFSTYAEPGPINNWAMLCPHGGLLQSKIALIDQIAVPISQSLWDFLYHKFGGGPVINMLFECEQCRRAAEALARRQYNELSVFTKYNGLDNGDLDTGAIYAISMPWLRKWQQFVRGLTHKEPGPIANNNIAPIAATTQTTELPTTLPIRNVRMGSDYAQLNAPLWRFLHGIYGGGPEIMLRGSLNNEEIEIIDQDEYEASSCKDNGDVSDTESNIGQQRNTTNLNETDQDYEQDRDRDLGRDQNQDRDIKRELRTQMYNESSTDEFRRYTDTESSSLQSHRGSHASSRESKRSNKHHSGSSKRSKAVIVLRSSLRKKTFKGKSALKNAELFGLKGVYSELKDPEDKDTEDAARIQRLDAHSTENLVVMGKHDAFNSHSRQQQQEQQLQAQSQLQQPAFPTDHQNDQLSQFANANLNDIQMIQNSRHPKAKAELSSTRNVRRRNKSSKGKNVITLQKFSNLRESSASTETDV